MRFLNNFHRYIVYFFLCFFILTTVFAAEDKSVKDKSTTTPKHQSKKKDPVLEEHFHLRRAAGATGGVYESPNGDYRFYAGGYFQADLLSLHHAFPLRGDADLRAARLSLGFDYHRSYQFYVSYDFATSRLYNLLFTYDNFSGFLVNVGQFSPVFGLENTTNIPLLTFLEESLPTIAFSPPYVPGAEVGFYYSPFVFYASAFAPTIGSTVVGRTPYGATFTAAFAPIHTETRVVHLGISGWHQGMDSSHSLTLSAEPEIFSYNQGELISTSNINNVSTYDVIDSAAVLLFGPFSIQSEYSYSWINRDLNFSSPQFSGYYVMTSFFLTGESRLYNFKYASFVDITPIKGRFGAWELAFRYSKLNLNDRDINGGREQNVTAGLNWYPIPHVEVLLNYVRAMTMPNANGVNQTANMYALRLQFAY
jgi:phosphate-selective porin OprO/OprP